MRCHDKIRWARKVLFSKGKRCMPEQVIFFITNKCNLACAHCFYWANLNKEVNEATLEEIERFSRSLGNFSFLTLTGGEPFLRDDIPETIKIFNNNNSVSSVSIPTNGYFSERIIKAAGEILRNTKDIDLAIKISLDGLERKHDAVRGAKGVFSKAVDTYHGLVELKKESPRFKVGIIITYSTLNQEDLPETLDYIEEKLKPDMISLNFARRSLRDPKIKEADMEDYLKLYRRILLYLMTKRNKQMGLYNRFYLAYKSRISEMIAQIINQKQYLFSCYAGRLLCIIDSSLNVYPCELIDRSFGNIRNYGYDFRKLWFSRDAETLRKEIQNVRCSCTYECGLQISTFFNFKKLLLLLPRMLWLNY